MTEAIEVLKRLKETIEKEVWHDEGRKALILNGVTLCIAKLELLK